MKDSNHDKYLLHARFLQTFIFWINYGKASIVNHLPSIEFEWTYEAKHDLYENNKPSHASVKEQKIDYSLKPFLYINSVIHNMKCLILISCILYAWFSSRIWSRALHFTSLDSWFMNVIRNYSAKFNWA